MRHILKIVLVHQKSLFCGKMAYWIDGGMVSDGNIETTELLLKIILKKEDIQVISVVGQRE